VERLTLKKFMSNPRIPSWVPFILELLKNSEGKIVWLFGKGRVGKTSFTELMKNHENSLVVYGFHEPSVITESSEKKNIVFDLSYEYIKTREKINFQLSSMMVIHKLYPKANVIVVSDDQPYETGIDHLINLELL
jgi:hypothetical protein